MGSVFQCLFRVCCDVDEDKEEQQEDFLSQETPLTERRRLGYSGHETSDPSATAATALVDPHHTNAMVRSTTTTTLSRRNEGFFRFFRRRPSRRSDSNDGSRVNTEDNNSEFEDYFGRIRRASISSPLKMAKKFDSSLGVPTIVAEEIVLPGSPLQKEMAQAAALLSSTHAMDQDECVICMEPFSPENPRMPTLCGCGTNKTYFHLPCLYQWMEHCQECPSCRQSITWEEL